MSLSDAESVQRDADRRYAEREAKLGPLRDFAQAVNSLPAGNMVATRDAVLARVCELVLELYESR